MPSQTYGVQLATSGPGLNNPAAVSMETFAVNLLDNL